MIIANRTPLTSPLRSATAQKAIAAEYDIYLRLRLFPATITSKGSDFVIIDKASRTVLELLNTSESDWPRGVFSFDYICKISGVSEDDIFPIIKGLVQQGLAEYATFNEDKHMGIALTQSGKSYKELRHLESRVKWRERLYGFISGIISGLLIAGIPQLIDYLMG